MFINQKRITNELLPFIEHFKRGNSGNILFQGPAGCGKTYLAKITASNIGEYNLQLPKQGQINIDFNTRIHIIDEIHNLRVFENLYPLMDSENFVFLFCTTEYGETPEPFLSRCIRFSFDPYSLEDLSRIIFNYAKSRNCSISIMTALTIAKVSRNSPRIAKQRFDRLKLMANYYNYDIDNIPSILSIFNNIGIDSKGYTKEDFRYLNVVKEAGFISLTNLASILRIDRNTIVKEIEPFLIEMGDIEITPKGRTLKR